LSKNGSVGEYQRNIGKKPRSEAVWIQLAAFSGFFGPKTMSIEPSALTIGLV
jgi:hypothetical protein